MHRWIRSGWLCFGCVFLLIPLWSQAGVRSYVVRRLYEPGLKQKFNVVYSLRGDVRSSTFEQSLPITVDAQLEINTEVLKVFENGQARIRYSFRYVKQEVDFFAEKDLPPPFTDTIRITPGGFPAEDETTSKFRQAQKRESDEGEQKESSFPGLDFLPDAGVFLLWIGLDVVPGPFYPLPIGAVREGDEWQIRYPTPFLDTRGGKLSIEQATVYTYPATVKVIGVKEVRGRPTLHVQQVTNAEIDIRLDDTLIELVRLRDRNIPRGRVKGTITGTIDYYLALSDGALVQASGSERLKLRAEYDPQTVREWQPDESWAEWEVQATFRQVLAEEKPSAPAPKPTTPPRRRR
ncbi:MAG: hypothetical protein KatS3mg021_0353 [Fimbriimonadales bacterium]|nr:MAG: hypothetical protein KatS3mg021_0353 [Fimbriimonadales bacterium]